MIPFMPRVGRKEKVVKCPRCGENAFDDAPNCGQCGAMLDASYQVQTRSTIEDLPAAKYLIYVCAGFWILIAVLYGLQLAALIEWSANSDSTGVVQLTIAWILRLFTLLSIIVAVGNILFLRWARFFWYALSWIAAICIPIVVFLDWTFSYVRLTAEIILIMIVVAMCLVTRWALFNTESLTARNDARRAIPSESGAQSKKP